MFVKVEKFIFLTNFVIVDMEEDREVPIMLGRPFLATGRTLIDVQKGELTMRVQDQEVKFNVFKPLTLPDDSQECFKMEIDEDIRLKYKKSERRREINRAQEDLTVNILSPFWLILLLFALAECCFLQLHLKWLCFSFHFVYSSFSFSFLLFLYLFMLQISFIVLRFQSSFSCSSSSERGVLCS